jgi:hypothetical protein
MRKVAQSFPCLALRLALPCLLVLSACGKETENANDVLLSGSGSSVPSKGIFSLWSPHSNATITIDLTGASLTTPTVITVTGVPLTPAFLSLLNAAGRNTSGLTAGSTRTCSYIAAFSGTSSSGVFLLDTTSDSDTPTVNACYEYDTFCDDDDPSNLCHLDGVHSYSIDSSNTLRVTWFGTQASSAVYPYGVSQYR